MHRGRPTVFINDQPLYPMVYALTDVPGGRWSWEEVPQHNIQNFCSNGIRLYQVDLAMDHIWYEDGRLDISLARRQIAGILEVCPEAAVIFRFHVTAPKWWLYKYPDEWVRYADTQYKDEETIGLPRIIESDNYPVRRVSMASESWRSEAGIRLREFLTVLAATPEGNAVAGIQVANGVYGEWHNWGFYWHEPDVGIPMTRFFRTWLKDRYGSDEGLQQAWNRQDARLATAEVPSFEERKTTAGIFRDPDRERNVIDYYTCVHQLVAENILHFARIVKQSWPRPIITGTFYGYYFSVFGRQAAGGHLALQRVLASPDIDYLSGPQAYGPESLKLGEAYRSRSLITSIRLHEKLWLDEMDVEPTTPIERDSRYDLKLRNSFADVRRNVLFSFTKGMGLWFYDFGVAGVDLDGFQYNHRGSRGTWDHPALMADIQEVKQLLESKLEEEYRSEADVLYVYDTESFYYTASLRGSDPVSNTLIDHNTLNAFKSGVVFDPIHISDLGKIDLTPYRVVVFGNTYLLTDEELEFIQTRVAREGRTLVWFYAPGYTDGATLDPKRISRLTGISVTPISLSEVPEIILSVPSDSAVTYRVGEEPFGPLFMVTDPGAEPFGRFSRTNELAVARKSFADHTAWYVSLPSRGIEPMRYILRESGAHIYSTQGDIVYAGGGILAVHIKEGGKHTVTLKNGKVLSFDLPPGASTLLLDSRTGEVLHPHP
ncbi:MAG: hypothetical protein WBG01_13245 [Bacteroidota bacterium]